MSGRTMPARPILEFQEGRRAIAHDKPYCHIPSLDQLRHFLIQLDNVLQVLKHRVQIQICFNR